MATPTPLTPQRNGNKAGGRALTGTRRSLRRETLICGLVSPHRMSASRRGTDVASPYPWTFSSRRSRDAEAAIRFLRKALSAVHTQEHSVINVDKNAAYPKAVDELIEKKELSEQVELRQRKYLNNIVEQDHRGIKRLVKPGMGFGSFNTARRTLKGYEMMNMIRKGQIHRVAKGAVKERVFFINQIFGVVA